MDGFGGNDLFRLPGGIRAANKYRQSFNSNFVSAGTFDPQQDQHVPAYAPPPARHQPFPPAEEPMYHPQAHRQPMQMMQQQRIGNPWQSNAYPPPPPPPLPMESQA
jgi:hypothetical protein